MYKLDSNPSKVHCPSIFYNASHINLCPNPKETQMLLLFYKNILNSLFLQIEVISIA